MTCDNCEKLRKDLRITRICWVILAICCAALIISISFFIF